MSFQTRHGGTLNESTPLLGGGDREPWYRSTPNHIAVITWATLCSNYVNVLLIFVPLGIIAGALSWSPTAVFILNFIAIMPLPALLSFAAKELAANLGSRTGGILNVTFGNAVELIVSVVALKQNEIRIVQASMLGSILSNMLLLLGCCFLANGLHGRESRFEMMLLSVMSSLMVVASASLIIPATLYATMSNMDKVESHKAILLLSHGSAIIFLVLYLLYLYFQFYSHGIMFDSVEMDAIEFGELEDGETLSPVVALITLAHVTAMVAMCAKYLLSSISPVAMSFHISKTFIGFILIPIVYNSANLVTVVVFAYNGKMELAIKIAVSSSIQIALFVTPFLVIFSWIIGKAMTLHFQEVETTVFLLSVLVVNSLIQRGKSNYLDGCMCLGTYTIMSFAFTFI